MVFVYLLFLCLSVIFFVFIYLFVFCLFVLFVCCLSVCFLFVFLFVFDHLLFVYYVVNNDARKDAG